MNKYKQRLLLGCIHHFKSDLINNMDHMRMPKQAEAKRDGVINPKNYSCNQFFNTEAFDAPKTIQINRCRP